MVTTGYQVAGEALRTDAAAWQGVAEVTGRAGVAAGGLALGEKQLSWAARPSGLLDSYAELQQKAVQLLAEATKNYQAMSATLLQVAATYESADDSGAAGLEGVWDVKGA